jgi:monoamine oxidase
MDLLDVAVVGGGQAGLAIARRLRRLGLRFLVLDASPEIGQAGSVSGSASHPKPALQNTSAVSNRPGTVISVRAKRSPTPVSIQARIIGSTGRSSRPTTAEHARNRPSHAAHHSSSRWASKDKQATRGHRRSTGRHARATGENLTDQQQPALKYRPLPFCSEFASAPQVRRALLYRP